MKLSRPQMTVLRYLAGAERATPRTILRITGANGATVTALHSRGLVRYDHSATGIRFVRLTLEGERIVKT